MKIIFMQIGRRPKYQYVEHLPRELVQNIHPKISGHTLGHCYDNIVSIMDIHYILSLLICSGELWASDLLHMRS